MTIVDKFLSLSQHKQESIIDQLVDKVISSGDVDFSLKVLSTNLGTNGQLILSRVKEKIYS